MRKQHKQAGFTLIEVIAVLVILGILAAIATPKFMDMQREARIAAVKGLKAAMQSADELVRAKALAKGLASNGTLSKTDAPDLTGDVALKNYYPQDFANLKNAMRLDGFKKDGPIIILEGYKNCGATRTKPTDTTPPNYGEVLSGC